MTSLVIQIADDSDAIAAARAESQMRRDKIVADRNAKREKFLEARPADPDILIGFLADAPEVAEAIRALAYERRSQAYGI